MGVTAKVKKEEIERFMKETGATRLRPQDFLDWLKPQKDAPLWQMCFGRSNDELAEAARIEIVRGIFASVRIKVTVQDVPQPARKAAKPSSFVVKEMPAYISPVRQRAATEGYEPVDPKSEVSMADLAREAELALTQWRNRYQGTLVHFDIPLSMVDEIQSRLMAAGRAYASAAE